MSPSRWLVTSSSASVQHSFALGLLVGVWVGLGWLTTQQSPGTGSFSDQSQVLGQQTRVEPVVRQVTTSQKVVSLTFDDGPGPQTAAVLDILAEQGVKATFFVVGESVTKYPEVVRRIEAEGHQLGNHTQSHPKWLFWTPEDMMTEIQLAQAALRTVSDSKVFLLRSPYGFYPPALIHAAEQLGLQITGWSVDPEDWRRPGVKKIVERVVSAVEPGAIILLHDGPEETDRSQTVEALPTIISQLHQQEYQLVVVSDLLRYQE